MSVSLLRATTLFGGLPEGELALVARSLPEVAFPSGSVLLREGEEGDSFFIIADGEIEIVRGLGTRSAEVLAVRGAGEIVGEFALLSDQPARTASVRARTEVRAFEVTRTAFEALLHRNPTLAFPMLSHLAARLHEAHALALQVLLAAQEEVVQKRSMERELQRARTIQQRMIPDGAPVVHGYEFAASLIPMSLVGGDFYDFIELEPGRLGIVIGDVAGHGVPAALVMSMTIALVRLEATREARPSTVLLRVNQQLAALNRGESFVTAIYGVLDAASGVFTYARAGHEPFLRVDTAGNTSYPETPGGFPLGLIADLRLADATLRLGRNDTIVCYSDGVVEARDARRAFFGRDGLNHIVRQARCEGAQAVCTQILAAVAAHNDGQAQHDDITVLCMRKTSD